MKSINHVQLLGYIGRDPVSRVTADNTAVVNLSVATTTRYKDKATGDNKESTEWHRVVAFGKTGELLTQMFTKGSRILIEGRLRTRSWTDQDEIERSTTEIVLDDFIALDRAQPAQSDAAEKPKQRRKSSTRAAA